MSGSPSSATLTSLPQYHDSGNNKAEAGRSGEMETTSLEANSSSCVKNSLGTPIPKLTNLAMTVTTTVTTTPLSSTPLLVPSCSSAQAASKPSSPAVASPTLVNFPVDLPVRRPAPPSFSAHQPATKRARFDGCALGNKPFTTGEVRQALIRWKRGKMEAVRDSYNSHVAESFFLTHDGNLMDMASWLKRPTPELLAYHKQHRLEGDTSNLATSVRDSTLKMSSSGMSKKEDQQDQMVEKARHEASVVARIAQLRKEGLWTEKRLPKVHEPPRPKCHWDYLLEEMVWLSADFAQERKWKKAAAKKCAKMVQKYFQDKELAAERAQKEEEMRLKKIASFMAREIRTFWSNIEKLVHFKINSKHEEKKKKALDQQLSFIVDQTEKYSGMLAESMKRPADSSAVSTRSETPSVASLSDDEFEPCSNSEDDEATIAKEDDDPNQQATEVELLQQESGQTIDDLLTSLPPEYLESLRAQAGQHVGDDESQVADGKEEPAAESTTAEAVAGASPEAAVHSFTRSGRKRKLSSTASLPDESIDAAAESESSFKPRPSTSSDAKAVEDASTDRTPTDGAEEQSMDVDDDEYVAKDEDDDEETLAEQEQHEGKTDYEKEIAELQADNDLSLEELRRKYAASPSHTLPSSHPSEAEDEDESSADEDDVASQPCSGEPSVAGDDEDDGLTGSSDGDSDEDEDEEEEVGLKSLLDEAMETEPSDSTAAAEAADQQLEQATAVAEALQPKGFTLSSTAVTTPVPFLLKHTLREYQHVGLDWLVTMYDKSLNGILADEMGLGKTIQTISLLAHLACVMGNWGPHLIVVPTSVMLNWEMELKKWCPAFKILTYFGTQKERKMKRTGWTKLNAFHVCITSYKLVIQDHQSFRRKKWKYFILDEAQNIKNFKSKRWQLLLNFQSDRRLLLTGTPLQNNLMELWSLMHFLMPHVFSSHREFREWFSNPVSGMIQGNSEYNDNIIKRLHKVLRPFILRRLKSEVEQQMPKKYEHVVMCRLSKRQRFLYEEFMSRTKTKETLASGNFLSVINVLMQLRKVCNHPNLFEERPTVSPFMMEPLTFSAPSCCWAIAAYDPFKHVDLFSLNLLLCSLEMSLTAFAAHRVRRFQCPQRNIIEIDSAPPPPPRCPPGKIRLHVRQTNKPSASSHGPVNGGHPLASTSGGILNRPRPMVPTQQGASAVPSVAPANSISTASNVRYQLIQHQGALRAIPIAVNAGTARPGAPAAVRGAASVAKPGVAGTQQLQGLQFMHTASGQLLLTATTRPQQVSTATPASVASPTTLQGVSTSGASALLQKIQSLQGFKNLQGSVFTLSPGGRPVLRLPPPATAAAKPAQASPPVTVAQTVSGVVPQARSTPQGTPQGTPQHTPLPTPLPSPTGTGSPARPTPESRSPARSSRISASTPSSGAATGASAKPEDGKRIFHLSDLEEARAEARRAKLSTLARLNTRRCRACPIYGGDLIEAVMVPSRLPLDDLWRSTSALCQLVWSEERRLHQMKSLLDRFVLCVPAVVSRSAQLVLHHPDPSEMVRCEHTQRQVVQLLAPAALRLHSVTNSQLTQFPDPRLIQYDCGKLQTLDRLLRTLKTEGHRVLIFTQMTRMLDVFEAFLNCHGHIYLRLDGTTKVQDRQVLMERFNQDKRIFCFILSTRSGGIGVNLTGADTVIFYDSDWNPTMDAQAQDRCHRIGQTRDVHIYRLISEKTIEENILKKANQKRMLGNLAIEGGNFTTAYFREQTIQELFSVSSDADASHRMAELLDKQSSSADGDSSANIKSGALENALAAAEDETDVVAARYAMAEAAADLAEFDETIPLNEDSNASGATAAGPAAEKEESSKVELEINKLMQQLTGVERYAMHVLESADEGIALEQHRLEQQLEQQKREWEQDRQRALQSTDPLMHTGVKRPLQDDDDDDEDPLTVSADQVNERSDSDDDSDDEDEGSDSDSSDEEDSESEGEGEPNEDDLEKTSLSENKNFVKSSRNSNSPDLEKEETVEEDVTESTPRTRSRVQVDIDLWTLDERDKSCGREQDSADVDGIPRDSPNDSVVDACVVTPGEGNCAEVDLDVDGEMVCDDAVALYPPSNGDVESAVVMSSHDHELNNGDESSLVPIDESMSEEVVEDTKDDTSLAVGKLKLDLVNASNSAPDNPTIPNGDDGVG